MTQTQLDRAVARATGESFGTIARRGFSMADPLRVAYDPEPSRPGPRYLDWDELQRERCALLPSRHCR